MSHLATTSFRRLAQRAPVSVNGTISVQRKSSSRLRDKYPSPREALAADLLAVPVAQGFVEPHNP